MALLFGKRVFWRCLVFRDWFATLKGPEGLYLSTKSMHLILGEEDGGGRRGRINIGRNRARRQRVGTRDTV